MSTLTHSRRRLIVTDFDSTLVRQEVIDVLARHAGVGEQVAAITERAMRGEIDFRTSLRQRVALLAGLDTSTLPAVRAELELSPGAREFVAECHARGWVVGVISGGFTEVVRPVAASLGIDYVRANRFETEGDEIATRLTGRTVGSVVDAGVKARTLRQWAANEHISLADTIAIGDGANDLEMLAIAGIGVAYRAKPAVQAAAKHHVEGSLAEVLDYVYGLAR